MTDYCDTCKQLKEEISRVQAIMNRLQQSGSAPESELRRCEEKKEEERKLHKITATESREFLNSCMDTCKQQWKDITKLTSTASLTTVEREKLKSLQHCFTLTISADYQQAKLIPYGVHLNSLAPHITCRKCHRTFLESLITGKRRAFSTCSMKGLVRKIQTTQFPS